MSGASTPRNSTVNGRLWGPRARDWADIQERMAKPAYEAVPERATVGADTRYLDIGCGSGMAAQLAAARGARADNAARCTQCDVVDWTVAEAADQPSTRLSEALRCLVP